MNWTRTHKSLHWESKIRFKGLDEGQWKRWLWSNPCRSKWIRCLIRVSQHCRSSSNLKLIWCSDWPMTTWSKTSTTRTSVFPITLSCRTTQLLWVWSTRIPSGTGTSFSQTAAGLLKNQSQFCPSGKSTQSSRSRTSTSSEHCSAKAASTSQPSWRSSLLIFRGPLFCRPSFLKTTTRLLTKSKR